jgi:hypothetical protein
MRRLLLATVAAIAFTTGAQASGKMLESERWSEPGQGWAVDYYPETNACVAGRFHTNDVSLQIAYVPNSNGFTLRLLSDKWSSKIEDGATYKLRMDMDGGADRWQGTARGFWTNNGHPGVYMSGLTEGFIKSFMRRNRVDIYNGTSGAWITALALDGSSDAMVGLIDCLNAHDSGASKPAKPQAREFRS